MPEWLLGALASAFGIYVTQWLQLLFRKGQYRHENLMERYSEFVAVASADLLRVKSLAGGLALAGDNESLHKLDSQRHESARDLRRIEFQIRLLESDENLMERVTQLSKSQPFMAYAVPAQWHQGTYDERFDKFQSQIVEFEKQLDALAAAVVKRHASVRFLP